MLIVLACKSRLSNPISSASLKVKIYWSVISKQRFKQDGVNCVRLFHD